MIPLKPGSSTTVNCRIEEHRQWTNFSLVYRLTVSEKEHPVVERHIRDWWSNLFRRRTEVGPGRPKKNSRPPGPKDTPSEPGGTLSICDVTISQSSICPSICKLSDTWGKIYPPLKIYSRVIETSGTKTRGIFLKYTDYHQHEFMI